MANGCLYLFGFAIFGIASAVFPALGYLFWGLVVAFLIAALVGYGRSAPERERREVRRVMMRRVLPVVLVLLLLVALFLETFTSADHKRWSPGTFSILERFLWMGLVIGVPCIYAWSAFPSRHACCKGGCPHTPSCDRLVGGRRAAISCLLFGFLLLLMDYHSIEKRRVACWRTFGRREEFVEGLFRRVHAARSLETVQGVVDEYFEDKQRREDAEMDALDDNAYWLERRSDRSR